jgi:predicted GNAT superfamily acetyltransferase
MVVTGDDGQVPLLRPIEPGDHAFVLDLNQGHVDLLAPLDQRRLDELLGWADRADVIEHDDRAVGFVLTFAPGKPYDSANYRWFTARFGDSFYYLDRIVVDPTVRRAGIGAQVYTELEAVAAAYGRIVLEVNVEPPNEPSLAFHRARGYAEVGQLGGPGKRVTLMEKPVGSVAADG